VVRIIWEREHQNIREIPQNPNGAN